LDQEMIGDVEKIQDLLESVCELQQTISRERGTLAKLDAEGDKQKQESRSNEGETGDLGDLQDTIAMLEREIVSIQHDIEMFNKNLKSCELQHENYRVQLQKLMLQNNELHEHEGRVGLDLFKLKATGPEGIKRKKKEEEYEKIKEYIDANLNTRMTVMDQRSALDKYKQQITHQRDDKSKQLDSLQKRLKTVQDLSKSAMAAVGASDSMLRFLRENMAEISKHFDSRGVEAEFVTMCKDFESDTQFLEEMEARMKAMMGSTSETARMDQVCTMLQDIINLHRAVNSMHKDKWLKDDVDVSIFFNGATKLKEKKTLLSGMMGGMSSLTR